MSPERETNEDLPIACTLTPGDLAAMTGPAGTEEFLTALVDIKGETSPRR